VFNSRETVRFRSLLAVAVSMVLLMALPIALGRVYATDDLAYCSLPLRSFFAGCLAAGQDPSWCPALFGGFSLYGEGGGFAHPLVRGLYGALPLDLALNLEVIWPYPVMIAGFALLLGRWGLRRDAALFGGLVFAFGGYNVLQYIHTSVSSLLGHLPWLLLSIDVALRSGDRRRAATARIALSLLTASQILIGHIQYLWISMLGEALYALFLTWLIPEARRRLTGLAASVGFGILAGAIQLLPSWEAFRDSRRERPTLTYVASGSLPPVNLLQPVAPYLTRSRVMTPPMATDDGVLMPAVSMADWRVHEFAAYLGSSVPVLLAWLLVSRRKLAGSARPLALFSLGLAAIGLVLAFGDFTPLFRLMVKVPVIGRFRISARYLVLYQAAGAMLAALAFATLANTSDGTERVPWRRLWPVGLPLALSLFLCLAPGLPEGVWPPYLRGETIAASPLPATGPLLVGLATALVVLAARGWRGALPVLVVFAAVDQASYGLHAILRDPPKTLSSYLAARRAPPTAGEGTRVAFAHLHAIWQDPYLMKGLRTMQGYVSLSPRRRLSYDTPNSMRVAGSGWVMPGVDEQGQPWERAPAPPLPRARLVTRTQASTDPRRDLESIDPETTALTVWALDLPTAAPGLARITNDRPGKIDVVTEAPTRQLLIISESFHDGWGAEIDGRFAHLGRAYGDFLACVVPEGTHRVKLRFRSHGRRAGAWLSLAGLILATVVPLVPFAPGRMRPVTPSIVLGPKRAGRDAGGKVACVSTEGDNHA
jgi:hypothetical protein